jgi:hypothetical protein
VERIEPGARLDRLRRLYRSVALFVFNSLVLLVLFNLALYAAFAVLDALRSPARVEDWGGGYVTKLKEAYREIPEADIRQLVRETLALTYGYEPFTQFRDRTQRGKFVNVDSHGFRHSSGQRPWPPPPDAFSVFFFGGSTTFGWGLHDASTIPSILQRLAPRIGGRPTAVYNFARMAYFSTQERILFEQLLLAGHRPDAAIFVDGLNDLHWRDGRPLYDSRFATLLEGRPPLVGEWPMLRLARALRKRLPAVRASSREPPLGDSPQDFEAALARYLGNRKLIESTSAASGVVPIFVWQPVPSYKHGGRRYHDRFFGSVPWRIWSLDAYGPVYEKVEGLSRSGELGPGFLWCGGVQEGLDELLYIDLVHYNPRLAELVAECIVRQIRERGLLPALEAPADQRKNAESQPAAK